MRASFASMADSCSGNPIDMVEKMVMTEDWNVERRGDCEFVIERPGVAQNFDMFFVWSKEFNCLQISCVLDIFVKKEKEDLIFATLAHVNEQLWSGCFSLWSEEGLVIYRNSLLLNKEGQIDENILYEAINSAIKESEKYCPLFEFTLKHGIASRGAMEVILMPPQGRA